MTTGMNKTCHEKMYGELRKVQGPWRIQKHYYNGKCKLTKQVAEKYRALISQPPSTGNSDPAFYFEANNRGFKNFTD